MFLSIRYINLIFATKYRALTYQDLVNLWPLLANIEARLKLTELAQDDPLFKVTVGCHK